MCGQLVTGWAGDAENWGSPWGALNARGLIPMKMEGGIIHSYSQVKGEMNGYGETTLRYEKSYPKNSNFSVSMQLLWCFS